MHVSTLLPPSGASTQYVSDRVTVRARGELRRDQDPPRREGSPGNRTRCIVACAARDNISNVTCAALSDALPHSAKWRRIVGRSATGRVCRAQVDDMTLPAPSPRARNSKVLPPPKSLPTPAQDSRF